jgi:hypothetical protein
MWAVICIYCFSVFTNKVFYWFRCWNITFLLLTIISNEHIFFILSKSIMLSGFAFSISEVNAKRSRSSFLSSLYSFAVNWTWHYFSRRVICFADDACLYILWEFGCHLFGIYYVTSVHYSNCFNLPNLDSRSSCITFFSDSFCMTVMSKM